MSCGVAHWVLRMLDVSVPARHGPGAQTINVIVSNTIVPGVRDRWVREKSQGLTGRSNDRIRIPSWQLGIAPKARSRQAASARRAPTLRRRSLGD